MLTPKLRPLTSEIKQPSEVSPFDQLLRILLIVWAFLRLTVSVLWTGAILIKTIGEIKYRHDNPDYTGTDSLVEFGIVAILAQLVEFGVLVTFITAGIKKNAKLYLFYYRYCIITLAVYVLAVIMCLALQYEHGHFIGEIYLTYHFNDSEFRFENYDAVVFAVAATCDICLEMLLIVLVKRLYLAYSNDKKTGENV